MGDSAELLDKVAKWVRQQGYPLELRTARELESKKISATIGWYYTDPDSGQERESDVLALATRWATSDDCVAISLAIECKSARDKPWVLVAPNSDGLRWASSPWYRLRAPQTSWLSGIEQVADGNLPTPLLDMDRSCGYTLVRAFAGGNEDVAFSAMMSVAKAARSVHAEHEHDQETGNFFAPSYAVVVPVLLVDAPLFRCDLNSDRDVRLTPIDQGTVIFKHRVVGPSTAPLAIKVVTSEAFPSLVDDVNVTADSLSAVISPDISCG